jgi:amino acid/amide ABC transporter membrane protein 1, HAAT family (TC 3.A.1.4.-)/amino acid/amide ABC transporter membrane protein 2, HAAT family (TC 3.A.1.4.-)
MDFLIVQLLTGLASASKLFLVASGLSVIFGVTRVVNFAHGSFFMLGAYLAHTAVIFFAESLGPVAAVGYWLSIVGAAAAVGIIGGLVEMLVLRRVYHAPELFQLLATFAVALIVQDLVLMVWGPEDRFGPRAPGLSGTVSLLGHRVPSYDLFLIALGPLVLAALWLLFRCTRWGIVVRAATQDREMIAALGVRRGRLFTLVFMLGCALAGLGGALQVPVSPVHHTMDLQVIVEAFVIVVIGGLGSVAGAYLAALLIGILNAFALLIFPEVSLVLPFLVMTAVLILRPWGLLGRPIPEDRRRSAIDSFPQVPLSKVQRNWVFAFLMLILILPVVAGDYVLWVAAEVLIFALFAISLHLLVGIGGIVSFGQAAFFGLGAYAAALLTTRLGIPVELAVVAAPLIAGLTAGAFGAFCVRRSGVYLAMLTLAFAQILWSVVFQWYDVTGGDNGILGIWPPSYLASPTAFYYLTAAIAGGAVFLLRQITFSPFGMALRACRDSGLRAEALGVDCERVRQRAFLLAGAGAGLAGALYACLKGSVFPDVLAVPVSVEGLVMILLGGVQTLIGPAVGAGVFTSLHVLLSSYTDYWRLVVGAVVLALVIACPEGIVGFARTRIRDAFDSKKPVSR